MLGKQSLQCRPHLPLGLLVDLGEFLVVVRLLLLLLVDVVALSTAAAVGLAVFTFSSLVVAR